jgi:hypothetical protein
VVERVRGFRSKARKSSIAESGPDSTTIKRAIRAEFTVHGVVFANLGQTGREWLKHSVRNDKDSELASLLFQIEEEGYAHWEEDTLMLPWDSVFELDQSLHYGDVFRIMELPRIESWRPVLQSVGGFSDEDFSIFITGWIPPSDNRIEDGAVLTGALIQHNDKLSMLDSSAWGVVSAIRTFHQREAQQRTANNNRRAWAEIRKHALAANADVSDFLRNTVVLAPDRLRLELRRGDENAPDLVEVIPTFEGSPQRWI